METLLQDMRYGFRMLVKNPAFTTLAVLTLALGIGANTAIFTLVNAVLLSSLPIHAPSELVALGDPSRVNDRSLGTPQTDLYSYPLYREFRDNNTAFSGLYAAATEHKTMVDEGNQSAPAQANTVMRMVSGNYFSVLGVNAVVGRTITPDDDKVQHGGAVAVLSYNYWKDKFGLTPLVLGKTVRLNGYPFTIIGVTPPGFFGDVVGDPIAIFIPLSMQLEVMRGRDWYNDPNASWLQAVGRLKPGVNIAQAKANVNTIFKNALAGTYGARLTSDDRKALLDRHVDVVPAGRGLSEVRDTFHKPLLLLMGIVGLVLLIACVNVANLLLARASSRSKEIAVRLAIGAAPLRIVRQLLTESILLAFMGGIVGSLLALWGVALLVKIVGAELATGVDFRIFGFTAAVCLLTGILFGLVPALNATRFSVIPALKDIPASGGTSRSRWTWGKGLVTSQVALSLLVLFAAGLIVRSLRNLQSTDLGYPREHLLLLHLDPTADGYDNPRIANLVRELQDRLAATPGVKAVTFSENGLFSGTESAEGLTIPGYDSPKDADKVAAADEIGPNYFSVLHIPIVLGREIGPQDTATSPPVAVVNQAFVKFYFPNQNPIGRKFAIDHPDHPEPPFEIVGVVGDAKEHSLGKPPSRRFYRPFFQETARKMLINVEIRTVADPSSVTASVRKVVQSIDASLPIESTKSLDVLINSSITEQIALAKLSGFFAALALGLACIGLYGVMSYTVAGRTREIGVRMALGAKRADVLRLVLGEAMLLVGVGIVVGIPAALGGSRLLSSMLFGLNASDPASLLMVTVVLGAVAALASYIPARRATKVDPMIALRYE